MGNYRFILSGGGTGGHIFPAIAIANELKLRFPEAEFLFVGAKGRMEMEKVPQAGYKIEGLWISGIQRKLTLKNLMFPLKLLSSLIKAKKIIKKFKPDVVVGTGGYASGPTVRMAASRNIPAVLQEQNSYAGITNKWLAGRVQKICVAYDGMERFFPADKIIKTGNPIRKNILDSEVNKTDALRHFGLSETRPVLFILGGSQGARRINELVASRLSYFEQLGLQLIWQCGRLYHDEYRKYESDQVRVMDFLNRMDLAYAAADFIISRAGAGSVSELCMVGKPVIFVPSPNVAEDHQTKNAQALANRDAALLIREADIDEKFEERFSALVNSVEDQESLSKKIKELAMPRATEMIVDEIEKLLEVEN